MASYFYTLHPMVRTATAATATSATAVPVHPAALDVTRPRSAADGLAISAIARVMSVAGEYRDKLDALDKRANAASIKVRHYGQVSVQVRATGSGEIARANGSFRVEVKQLAGTMELVSTAVAVKSTKAENDLGKGRLKIESATGSVDVAVSGTLQEVAEAINADANNTLVKASVVAEGSNQRLILRARSSGTDAAFSVNVTVEQEAATGDGLRLLNYHDHSRALTLRTEAANAKVVINDVAYERATNVISDAASGIEFVAGGIGVSDVIISDSFDASLAKDIERASITFADNLVAAADKHSEVRAFVETLLYGDDSTGRDITRVAVLAKLQDVKVVDDTGELRVDVDAVDDEVRKTDAPSLMARALVKPPTIERDTLLEKLVGNLAEYGKQQDYRPDKSREGKDEHGNEVNNNGLKNDDVSKQKGTETDHRAHNMRDSMERTRTITDLLKNVAAEKT